MVEINNNQEIIHVYLSTDKTYFSKCIIAITSILENHKTEEGLFVHILTSDLGDAEKLIIDELAKKYETKIDIVYIDEAEFEIYTKNQNMKWLSINAFYRFFIPKVAPIHCKKAIYLDCDLIVTGEISSLYNQNIYGYKAGVVEDKMANGQISVLGLNSDKYFNSGVILLNLEELRKTDFLNETVAYFNKNSELIMFYDQDILNGIWDTQVKYLDERFNAQSYLFLRMKRRYKKAGVCRIENPIIIHYTGALKPWQVFCKHKRKNEWLKYQQKTVFKFSELECFLFKLKQILSRILYIQFNKKNITIFVFGARL